VQTDAELLAAFAKAVRAKIRSDLSDEALRATALREQVVPLVRWALEEARAAGHCRGAWLFGSFAGGPWGQPGAYSDIDLLVEGDEEAVAALVARAARREVHALALNRAPASLRERAISDGLPL
jgi:predicted nucleotidyltransferase